MAKEAPHIIFPLDSLIEQLRLSGLEVTPGQRLQLLQTLDAFGTEALRQPEKLKYRLCPLIAHSATQQTQFYQAFDRFLENARAYELPEKVELRWWQQIPRYVWGIIALTTLGVIAFLLLSRERPEVDPSPILHFQKPSSISLGDTVFFENRSTNIDTGEVEFRWELIDSDSNVIEKFIEKSYHWSLPITESGISHYKTVRLIAFDRNSTFRDTLEDEFLLRCNDFPGYSGIVAPLNTQEDSVFFQLAEPEDASLLYEWDFGDSTSAEGYQVEHIYNKAGVYNVELKIYRPNTEGHCEQLLSHRIVVKQEKVFLTYKKLQADVAPFIFRIGIGTWILLSLLTLAAAFFLIRWLRQSPPEPEKDPKEKRTKILDERFAHSDKGPYFIPFRSNNHLLKTDQRLFRLADNLRQRQEGLRRNLDIPATIKQTIEQGGFPSVQWKMSSVPPEYLFLIDEQAPHSHQAALYAYLYEFLKGQDVHVVAFWYKTEFNRFWNEEHPDGLSLEAVQGRYPFHRLLLMGDAHALMEPFARNKPELQAEKAQLFEHWKHRILLTPFPANSWTYVEDTLYQLFPMFSNNGEGLQSAIAFLDLERDEEDERAMPAFAQWQEAQDQPPRPPDANYRNWKKPRTYQEYLKNDKALYRWLCALAVYPNPDWSLTIAIGNAIGAPVNLDNLQVLAHIPFLQGKAFSPRLRKELLAELDEETEKKAREAVKKELEAIAPQLKNSHANLELQRNLAMQSFLLAPKDPEHADTIRHLLETDVLGKKQIAELNYAVEREVKKGEDIWGWLTQFDPDYADLEEEQDVRRKSPLILGRDFYWGILCSLLALIGAFGIFWTDGTEIDGNASARDNLFYSVVETVDSAVIYNNLGVERWQDALEASDDNLLDAAAQARAYFNKAIGISADGSYPLAENNLAKAFYHSGIFYYHQYLQDFKEEELLRQAKLSFFEAGKTPELYLDGRHAEGLANYYQDRRPEANSIYNELSAIRYFDTLSLRYNLRTLLFPQFLDVDDPACIPAFGLNYERESVLCLGETLSATIVIENNVALYLLNWQDGNTDTLRSLTNGGSISHLYTAPGVYAPLVTAYSPCLDSGATVQASIPAVTIQDRPSALINVSETKICVDNPVEFNSLPSPNSTFFWDFGDDIQVQGRDPIHSYTEPGVYTVTLIAASPCGRDTQTLDIEVRPIEDCQSIIIVRGQVVDSKTKKGIPNVLVFGDRLQAKTDLKGNFLLEVPPLYQSPDFPLLFRAQGYEEVERNVDLTKDRRLPTVPLIQQPPKTNNETDDLPSVGSITSPPMIPIKGGTFSMGCREDIDKDCDFDEKPAHQVTLSDFQIGQYEVTFEEYDAFCEATKRQKPDDEGWGRGRRPVINVSWDDAIEYCNWLSAENGLEKVYKKVRVGKSSEEVIEVNWQANGYRLPTEAEWEYAARSGGKKQKYAGTSEDDLLYRYGNFCDVNCYVSWKDANQDDGYANTSPVGSFLPNDVQLFDMTGNVYEWVFDRYSSDYYEQSRKNGTLNNPRGPDSGLDRVIRGGAWGNYAEYCRVSSRNNRHPTNRDFNVGFRLVLAPSSAE